MKIMKMLIKINDIIIIHTILLLLSKNLSKAPTVFSFVYLFFS